MKSKKPQKAVISNSKEKLDLRHGIHGSLMNNSIDAGQMSTVDDSNLRLATPDFAVPVGQTTHE